MGRSPAGARGGVPDRHAPSPNAVAERRCRAPLRQPLDARPGFGPVSDATRPADAGSPVYEFFAPFAHLPGRYEWCRIRSPTHGVFDCFIVLGESTAAPATVYVNGDAGAAFMADRYPESTCIRVGARDLAITEADGGRRVEGLLRAAEGPVHAASMTFQGGSEPPAQTEYGGGGFPVWGGRWTCWGVDLELAAHVTGEVLGADGRRERLDGVPGIVTLGSFGRLEPRAA